MCLGLTPNLEGEEMPVKVEGFLGGDRTDIALPARSKSCSSASHALGKPVVLVLLSGSALAVTWADAHVPGDPRGLVSGRGGRARPSPMCCSATTTRPGRLPVTFYKSVGRSAAVRRLRHGRRTYRYFRGEPLYPFGHGLSYTTFAYANLRLSKAAISADEALTVQAEVTNTGKRAGDEIMQLYLSYPDTSSAQPDPATPRLPAGQPCAGRNEVGQLHLSPKALALVNDDGQSVVEHGEYQVAVGGRQPSKAEPDGGVVTGAFRIG